MKKAISLFLCLVLFLFVACAEAGLRAESLSVNGNIKSLEIDSSAGSVDFYYHDKPVVEVSASEEFEYFNIGGVLRIKFPVKKFHIFNFRKMELAVYLPQDILLDQVEIDVSSATVNIGGLKAREIEIESSSGAIHANDIEADTVSVDSSSGSVHIGGKIKSELEIDSSSGSVHVNVAQLPKVTEIESSSGSVNLNVPANSGISLRLKTGSGKFKTNLPFMQPVHSKQYVLGDGSSSVVIETSSGNVTIDSI